MLRGGDRRAIERSKPAQGAIEERTLRVDLDKAAEFASGWIEEIASIYRKAAQSASVSYRQGTSLSIHWMRIRSL